MKLSKKIIGACFAVVMGGTAYADCGLSGEISVLSNAFPILDNIRSEVEACQDNSFKVVWKSTKDNKPIGQKAYEANPSPFDVAIGSNGTLAPLLAKGLVRPLDDLVAKYQDAYNIEDGMLIRVNGTIYAVAFQANAQHFMYRKDLFKKHGIAVPTTYDEVLAAAEKLKSDPTIEYPFGAAFKAGWNLGQEFNNIFLGFGGQFFKPGTNEPAFNSPAGINTLNLMKKLQAYMSPNALTLDTGAVSNQLRQGKIAMAFLWGSRAKSMDDPTASTQVGKIGFAAAPTAINGGNAATTTWWDGVYLPANSKGKDDQAFKAIMHGISDASVAKYNDVGTWLRSSYKPNQYAMGVIESFYAGAPSQPMNPAHSGIIHGIMGKQAGEVLSGQKTPEQALNDAEAEYIATAKEKGYLD